MASGSEHPEAFVQEYPHLENAFDDDLAVRRLLQVFLPSPVFNSVTADLQSFSRKLISRDVFSWIEDAERNLPYVKHWDTWGNRVDEVVTSEGWKLLRRLAAEEGLVALGYEDGNLMHNRVVQYAKLNYFAGSSASTDFYATFGDGAAFLLSKHMDRMTHGDSRQSEMFQAAYKRLISRVPEQAWTAGLFMTEKSNGTDVSAIETTATHDPPTGDEQDLAGYPLGPWSIYGYKHYSSGVEGEISVVLARTGPGRGLSVFYVPLYKQSATSVVNSTNQVDRTGSFGKAKDGRVLNGVQIQRLKRKIGTLPKTTAELIFSNMRGWMIGQEGRGIEQVVQCLNIGRLHVATAAVGLWARGLAMNRAWCKVRLTAQGKLCDIPLFMRVLAREHVAYKAQMCLNLFNAALLGCVEQSYQHETAGVKNLVPRDTGHTAVLLRLVTPVTKGLAAKVSVRGLHRCMESMGGMGFIEHEDQAFNISRLYRDASIGCVLDGTSEAQVQEMTRVLKGKIGALAVTAIGQWVTQALRLDSENSNIPDILKGQREALLKQWKELEAEILASDMETILLNGHGVMESLGGLVSGVLLILDASRDGDEAATEVVKEWVSSTRTAFAQRRMEGGHKGLKRDQTIVFGSTWAKERDCPKTNGVTKVAEEPLSQVAVPVEPPT